MDLVIRVQEKKSIMLLFISILASIWQLSDTLSGTVISVPQFPIYKDIL